LRKFQKPQQAKYKNSNCANAPKKPTELKKVITMTTPDAPLVLRHDDDRGVCTLTLNRPAAFNALSEEMLTALQSELDNLSQSQKLRVLVIAASGKAFCAGHDLRQMRAEPSIDYYQKLFSQCGQMMMSIQKLQVPVIAKVQGIATAAGCQLVAQCDMAVASSEAKFAVSGVNLGLFCATPSVALSRNVSRKAAFEMLVTGDFLNAEDALKQGLINQIASPEQLDACLETLLVKILSKPQVALAMGKELFYMQLETGIEKAYEYASQTMACNMMDNAALEGVQAFIEKRKPSWSAT
jgi:enoyl-CoA hydratase/carnithine racemase